MVFSEVLMQMDAKTHCGLLVRFRNEGIQFSSYMGCRWLVSKLILIIVAVLLLWTSESVSRIVGSILVGYVIGIEGADVRSFIWAKAKWELLRELIDWDKVEGCLKATA